jgi:hypothetical protein
MFNHVVVEQVVIEVALSHPPDQVIQLLLRILCKSGGGQRSIVPVISSDEPLEPEWLPRHGCVYGASAFGVGLESIPATSPFYLISLTSPGEIVFVRVDREQHA